MGRRGRQPVRLDAGFSVNALTVDQLDWEPIEVAARVSFNPEQRRRLIAALDAYFTASAFEDTGRPGTKDVNRRLDTIATHANGLADALATRDAPGQVAVGAVWPWAEGLDPVAMQTWLRKLALTAREHRAAADFGRPRKDATRELVQAMRAIWHEAGGNGRGGAWYELDEEFRGPVFDMAFEMIAQIAGNDAAKGKDSAIRAAISE
mgnify:CR=1 FL=1